MRIAADVMTEDPFVVRPSDTFEHCANTLRMFDIRHLPVVTAGDKIAGLIGDLEIFRHGSFAADGRWIEASPELAGASIAGAVRPAETLEPSASLSELITRLLEVDEDVVVLVDPQRAPVGIFTEHDALILASRELSSERLVGGVMARRLVTVALETSLQQAWELLQTHRIRHLPVRDGSRLVGVVSVRDLLWAGASVAAAGTLAQVVDPARPLVTTTAAATLSAVSDLMSELKIGCLPVVDQRDDLVGLVTVTDAIKALAAGLS